MKAKRGRPRLYPTGSMKFGVVVPRAAGLIIERNAAKRGLSAAVWLRTIVLKHIGR